MPRARPAEGHRRGGDGTQGEVGFYNAGGIRAGSSADLRAGRIVLTTNPDYRPSPRPDAHPHAHRAARSRARRRSSSGDVTFTRTPDLDTVTVGSGAAIVNWTVKDDAGIGTVDFLPAGLTGLFQNDPAKTANFTHPQPHPARRRQPRRRLQRHGAQPPHPRMASPRPAAPCVLQPRRHRRGRERGVRCRLAAAQQRLRELAGNGGIALGADGGGGSPVTIEAGARIDTTGYAALAGPVIVQRGQIQTGGSLVLAAANAATIDFSDGRPGVAILSGAGSIDAAPLSAGGDLRGARGSIAIGSAN